MTRSLVRACLSVALCACAASPSGTAPDGCAAGENPTLDVGAGASEYSALDDGDAVELVHGAQGGFHVVIALDGQFLDVVEGSRVPGQITATIDGVETTGTTDGDGAFRMLVHVEEGADSGMGAADTAAE